MYDNINVILIQILIQIIYKLFSGGSKGGVRGTCPPQGRNSFNFMQFLGKFGEIVCWRPPGELAPPSRGNPGSATAIAGFCLAIKF